MTSSPIEPQKIYANRFDATTRARKNEVWKIICKEFLQRYVPTNAAVLDVGAGFGEFINHIVAARKVALDMNPELQTSVAPDVKAIFFDANSGEPLPDGPYDVVFTSNFLEHVKDKATLTRLIENMRGALKLGGRILVLGPNIRFLRGEYWDFYDHHIPLTDRSVTELLELAGFEIEECIPRFLPYTMKSRLPSWSFLVSGYLKLPLAWKIFGGQFFVVGRKR